MKLLLTLFAAATSFELARCAREFSYANETLNHVIFGSELLKRACSGTCSYCYGLGYTNCGNTACYNPSEGQSCCSSYDYACDYGYYCAPGGLKSQCCSSSLTNAQCTSSINNGGSPSGLGIGAKIGIGLGVAFIVVIIAVGVGLCLCMRRRRRDPAIVQPVATGPWHIPGLSSLQEGPIMQNNSGWFPQSPSQQLGSPQSGWATPDMQNHNGWVPLPAPQNAGTPLGGWASPQMHNPGNPGAWTSPYVQGPANPGGGQSTPSMTPTEPYGGGQPVGPYPPRQHNSEHGTPVDSVVELAENPPTHPIQPAPPYSERPSTAPVYPPMTEEERRTAVEA